MRYQHFLLAVFVSFLCGAGLAHAQQAESVTPGQTQPPEVKEFQGYEDQWSNAVVKNDQYTMEFLLSPLYVDISSQGDVTTRNQQIAQLFQKGDEPVSLQQRVVSVRLFGDTAVVSGTYIVRWRANGSTREERGIFTHIYNRAQNHWACVNAQRTAVVDLTPGKQKTSQKKSDASEPFHIPLLYQGAQPSQSASGQNSSTQPPN
ncbi:MAG: nuclear transport factor 2 family protein [Acidobacteriaceae bacterium]